MNTSAARVGRARLIQFLPFHAELGLRTSFPEAFVGPEVHSFHCGKGGRASPRLAAFPNCFVFWRSFRKPHIVIAKPSLFGLGMACVAVCRAAHQCALPYVSRYFTMLAREPSRAANPVIGRRFSCAFECARVGEALRIERRHEGRDRFAGACVCARTGRRLAMARGA